MILGLRSYSLRIIFIALFFGCKTVAAVEFQPGVGVGAEYTDNAQLSLDSKVNELIAITYVGASLAETEGSLKYDATALLNKQNYTKNTFEDRRYLNLAARADWEMIRDRFNWFLSDYFTQRTVVALDSNAPSNLQDTNVFTFGANMELPTSARQTFSLIPLFNQYYYERQATNNKQYSLVANWRYKMFRLADVGLNVSTRKINYFEQVIADTTFTNMGVIINGQRVRSSFSINLGATSVKRDTDEEFTGFSGSVNWLVDLSSRSTFNTRASTDLTDTSSVAANILFNGDDVQITTDVIRNDVVVVAYRRSDALLRSEIQAQYRKLTYSDSPLDRLISLVSLELSYPVTQLLSSGAYARYNNVKQLDTGRLDEYYVVGGNLRYRFTRKLYSSFDIKYRTKESTFELENYDEFSVFASLVYGFGDVQRPTRIGGF